MAMIELSGNPIHVESTISAFWSGLNENEDMMIITSALYLCVKFILYFYQQANVIDGEALEDIGKAGFEVDRLAAEHRDARNVAWK